MVQFPPFAGSEVAIRGGEVTVRGGDAPTSPATSPKTLTTGGCGRGVLRLGGSDTWPRVSLAREPLNMRVNPLIRTPTSRYARGRRCPRANQRAHARVRGPRARCRAQAHMSGLACARMHYPRIHQRDTRHERARVRAGALLPCTGSGINEKPRVRENSGRLLLRLDSNQ